MFLLFCFESGSALVYFLLLYVTAHTELLNDDRNAFREIYDAYPDNLICNKRLKKTKKKKKICHGVPKEQRLP